MHASVPSNRAAIVSAITLVACLGAVNVIAEVLAPSVEAAVQALRAPKALVGIIISGVVLMPEGFAALRAARRNRLQTSLNLTLGSSSLSICSRCWCRESLPGGKIRIVGFVACFV